MRDGTAYQAGDPELDRLLSACYGEPLAVVREGAIPHFDAAPLHLISTASLVWVDAEYGRSAGDSRRYRPNIVIRTAEFGLAEDAWIDSEFRIGSCLLRITEPTERCVMPTQPQPQLPQLPDLLSFLGHRNDTNLGVYAEVIEPGVVSVGDHVVE